eukprot:Phypoly_transcript_01330.p1 GENE.Phypoly_transcript_01330~~Phypoly_transcript_01330.p1  ORF type:complete len:878 (+),score=128.72 Phypoly_transcript_01330:456-3089(+)
MPGVGELMFASFPLEKFAVEEHGDWWTGEKYDGVRFCWNAEQKKLYSRTGKEFFVLPSLVSHLPTIFLDGEFWFGRGQYTATRAIIHHSDFVRWQRLRMISFDAPAYDVQQTTFEGRYRLLLQFCGDEHPCNMVAFRILCTSSSNLQVAIKGIMNNGGEGVILRKAGSLYEQGRSPLLLKLKDTEVDQEAIVVGTDRESVQLQLPDGTLFNVPSEDNLVVGLKAGDIVTITQELRAVQALPVRPKILRIRTDLSWKEVLINAQRDGSHSIREHGFAKKPIGFWTRGRMREFLENFAKNRKKDPLRPSTWYSISADLIRQTKDGRAVLEKFKGGYAQALRYLFPDLKFDNNAFQRVSWHKTENRRAFFEEYARRNKFDPQNANNWYSESKRLMFVRGALGVIQYHNNNMAKALIDLFPNIGLEERRFQSQSFYHEAKMRRSFFEKYAKAHGFDPLSPDNWYAQREKILSTEGAFEVILHHGRSVSRSLLELFPDIGLEKTKFWLNGKWKDRNKRRDFFIEYAAEKGFDPLSAGNWYSVFYADLISRKSAKVVLSFHKNSVVQALLDLFPGVVFDKRKFGFEGGWEDPAIRKRFFENFARKNGFDPSDPHKWDQETTNLLMSTKGVHRVLQYHNNSVRKALRDLFPDLSFQTSWTEESTRRKFFEEYAKQNGFDPLVPDAWYAQSSENILSVKGAFSVIQYHNNSVSTALLDLFPEIGLDRLQFKAKYLWNDVENRRKFFSMHAKENNFDPKNASAWYEQPFDWIMSRKGATGVMSHYDGSIPKALAELFPDIGISIHGFHNQSLWHHSADWRRKFFEIYARNNGFDPLIPENWHKQPLEKIMSVKGILKVVLHHKRSVARALAELFPEMGLIHSKLWR